jgi:hypothetical protein
MFRNVTRKAAVNLSSSRERTAAMAAGVVFMTVNDWRAPNRRQSKKNFIVAAPSPLGCAMMNSLQSA